jgi:uncharacterized protein YyaL (SSP411 family)
MVAKFWDNQNGGFYQTSGQSEMPKLKPLYDGAIPSGNSVALHDLLWLSRLTNQPKYDKMAMQMAQTFAREVEGIPEAFTFFVAALDFQMGTSYSAVVVGEPKEQSTQEMLSTLRKHYLPTTTVVLKHPHQTGAGYEQLEGKATAYVCQNQTCLPPTNSITQMLKQLKGG